MMWRDDAVMVTNPGAARYREVGRVIEARDPQKYMLPVLVSFGVGQDVRTLGFREDELEPVER